MGPSLRMAMRATRSDDTILDGAFVPDHYIGRVLLAGAAGIDAFVLGILSGDGRCLPLGPSL